MQGGINNAALFGASQRSARSKLDQMAGISRPSGILASSEELMQAAMPMAPAPAPQPMPMPTAPQPTAPPSMPMNTAVAPMAPAPRPLNPMAGNPTAGQPVVQLNEGGFLNKVKESAVRGVEAINTGLYGNADGVDITMDTSEFDRVLKTLNPESTKYLLETYGDEAGIAQAAQRKLNNVNAAAESKDPAQISDQVLVEAGEQPTDAAKMDFAENVFGMEDVNDIDEINRRIANVAIGSAVGKGPDEFAKAVLMGLQTYKQTASARAAGAASAAGGSKTAASRSAKNAYQDAYIKAMGADVLEVPPGMTREEYAIKSAEQIITRSYTPEEIAAAGIQMGPSAIPRPRTTTDQPPTTPGDRYKDTKTGKIMVVGPDGTPTEE